MRCGQFSAAETTLREAPGRLSANHTDVVEPDVFPSRGIWAIHVSAHQHQSKDSKTYTIGYHFYLSIKQRFLKDMIMLHVDKGAIA